MSGAGIDPAERAQVLLLRGDELLAAGTPESLDEAMLAYQGGLEVAREPGVEDEDLPRMFEERIAAVRRRLDPSAAEEEDEPDEEEAERADRDRDEGGDGDTTPAGPEGSTQRSDEGDAGAGRRREGPAGESPPG